MNWFTVTNIDPDTYVISEYYHFEEAHSYLLIGSEKAVLIDSGLGIGDIKAEVEKITDLEITVVTTHVHWDHIGGHKYFNNILVHENDAQWLENGIPVPLNVIKNNVIKDLNRDIIPKTFDIDEYEIFQGKASRMLVDEDIINLGKRTLRVFHTPGHSPGHICLWEENRGFLYTGDLIYLGILFAFYESTDPVLYKKSIDSISKLVGVKKILPGHHQLNVPVNTIDKIKQAFNQIEADGLLHHGGGFFEYDDFAIKI